MRNARVPNHSATSLVQTGQVGYYPQIRSKMLQKDVARALSAKIFVSINFFLFFQTRS